MSPDILAAAAQLVETHGPSGFTMDDLARAAGLSRATLYRQVGSREAVLDALQAAGSPVGDRKEVRDRIFEGARAVFGRAGFDGATIEAIAAEAGVGVATIYRHFRDRESLVAGFLDAQTVRRAAREVTASPSGDLRHDLERLAEGILRALRDDVALVRIMLLEQLRGGPFLNRVRSMSPTRTLSSVAALLRAHVDSGELRAVDPQLLAQAFSGMLMAFGAIGPILGGLPVPDPTTTARLVTTLFLEGALLETARSDVLSREHSDTTPPQR